MRIALDAGHGLGNRQRGGYDPGACAEGFEEHVLMADLVDRLAADLKAMGWPYLKTVGIYTTRDQQADAWGADFFLSLHMNASVSPGGHGTECFIHPGAGAVSRKVAGKIQAYLSDALETRDRGVHEQGFAVLAGKCPGTLVEVVFITNHRDLMRYKGLLLTAELAILRGLLAGLGKRDPLTLPRKWSLATRLIRRRWYK